MKSKRTSSARSSSADKRYVVLYQERRPVMVPRRRSRGSVLILVVAVLVLLALMGTAFIVTSRSDSVVAANAASVSSVETLSDGVAETLKAKLVGEVTQSTSFTGTTNAPVVTGFAFGYGSATFTGSTLLASRVPTAISGSTPTNAAPRWYSITAPLEASATSPGEFSNPLGNAASTTTGLTVDVAYGAQGFTTGTLSPSETWGGSEATRRNVGIGAIRNPADGKVYPAFTLNVGGGQFTNANTYVVAADADGDGIADSGLVKIGGLSNPEYSGITFYYGLRVVDNNSAFNANTAWTTGDDYDVTSAARTAVRNNRIYPGAIGLRESLAPLTVGATYNEFDGNGYLSSASPNPYAANSSANFVGYRAGVIGASPTVANGEELVGHSIPLPDVSGTTGRGQETQPSGSPLTRTDFAWTTQQELFFNQVGMRPANPGYHGTGGRRFRFNAFSLSDQARLAYGFVLAPRAQSSGPALYKDLLSPRSALEKLLPGSLYRFGTANGVSSDGHPEATVANCGNFVDMRSVAYAPNEVGEMIASPGFTINSAANWFTQNFHYDVDPADTANPALANLNLRPLMVARNPVSQVTPFKPLPQDAVSAARVPLVLGLAASVDAMAPYTPVYDSTKLYNPGDVVYYASTASDGQYFVYGWRDRQTSVGAPTSGNIVTSAAQLTASTPWLVYDGVVAPTKVNVNTAGFGDLWRGFYLTMSGDGINVGDTNGYNGTNATVSPFGLTARLTSTLEELYRGMAATQQGMTLDVPLDAASEPLVIANPNSDLPTTDDQANATPSAISTASTYNPQRQFRSLVRNHDSTTDVVIPPAEMVKLRAAQAAVNAEYLRTINSTDSTNAGSLGRDDIVRRNIPLSVHIGSSPTIAPTTLLAQVYSAGRSPFITEVYASTDAGTSTKRYVAVELYNPYPFAISLANCKIEIIDRSGTPTVGGRPVETIYVFGTDAALAPCIPPNDYVVLDNLVASSPANGAFVSGTTGTVADDASARPPGAGTPIAGKTYYVAGLERAVNGPVSARRELVLSRPMVADIITVTTTGPSTYTGPCLVGAAPLTSRATTALGVVDASTVGREEQEYYVPFDSFNFSGLQIAPAANGYFESDQPISWPQLVGPAVPKLWRREFAYDYHYARLSDDWKFVYPGRFDGLAASGPMQQGLRRSIRRSSITLTPPFTAGTDQTPTNDGARFTLPVPSLGAKSLTASYDHTLPIQIANMGFGGPNAGVTVNTSNANLGPFGAMPRELDMLQIPYISPIRIRPYVLQTAGFTTPPNYIDVISLTADAAFAEDSDTFDTAEENVGRFTPITVPNTGGATTGLFAINEYDTANPALNMRYGWAHKLLDYMTVRSVKDLRFPNAAPHDKSSTAVPTSYTSAGYPADTGANEPTPQIVAVKPGDSVAPNPLAAFDSGIEGLVNINTAPLPVLAAVPWVRTVTGGVENVADDREDNIRFARAIIADREANGPFRSIFDLNRIQGFRTRNATGNVRLTGLNASNFGVETADVSGATSPFTTPVSPSFRTPNNGDFSPLSATGTTGATLLTDMQASSALFPGLLSTTTLADTAERDRNPQGDYEAQFIQLAQVSNLITTRSDTFTAYMVIEGWRNVGTDQATRVIQKRYAYILDRTGAAVGVPVQALDPGATVVVNRSYLLTSDDTDSAVVSPVVGGVAKPRPASSNVKVLPVPTP